MAKKKRGLTMRSVKAERTALREREGIVRVILEIYRNADDAYRAELRFMNPDIDFSSEADG